MPTDADRPTDAEILSVFTALTEARVKFQAAEAAYELAKREKNDAQLRVERYQSLLTRLTYPPAADPFQVRETTSDFIKRTLAQEGR